MNIWEEIKRIPDGTRHLADWIGSGGAVVDPATAQHRANTCLKCDLNEPGATVTKAVALAIKAQLGVKNKLNLRVDGEKRLHTCHACGCVLRLQIWEPQERVEGHLDKQIIGQLPSMCWKITKQ